MTSANASSSSDASLLLETASFAAAKHATQRRKNHARTPYINHPLDVARRIAGPGSSLHPSPPVWTLQAALLHDTLEDTETTPEEIARVFGERVKGIVMECSDNPAQNKEGRKQAQIDEAPHKSMDAKHVKLADKLSNLSDLASPGGVPVGWTAARVQEYFVWGARVVEGCKDANPGLASQLDTLFRTATFEHEGKVFKCHPSYK